jgi:prevent-host-death family protein
MATKLVLPPLEDDIEFSNVTKFRSSLLGAVERVQENPAKRYVITKRGEPKAVLISYQTYSLFTKVMDQALEGTEGQSRDEAIRSAFARLRQEQQPAASARGEAVAVAVASEPSAPADPESQLNLLERSLIEHVLTVSRQIDRLESTLKKQSEAEATVMDKYRTL